MNIDPALLQSAAAEAAGAQQYPAGALYVVATPIGNLADLTLRAIHVLGLVDALACEDTRVSAGLLRHLGLDKPLIALHQHNETQAAALVLQRLAMGQRVAYVSDAGTPAVSDPGAALVAQVAAAGHRVLPIPGASSALAALSVAGDARSSGFEFVGFLPSRGAERAAALRRLGQGTVAQVLFEAPHRIETLARELAALAPQRPLTLCRELTKQFETVATMSAAAAAGTGWRRMPTGCAVSSCWCCTRLEPADAPSTGLPAAALDMLTVLLRELPLKQAVSLAAELSGAPRNALYQAALQRKARCPFEPLSAAADFYNETTLLPDTPMISREPTLERLAIAQRVLLEPFGLDEAHAGARAGHHRRAPHRRRRPVLPEHAPRRLEPGRRHRQERQLQHRPGRGRARGGRREDRLRLFRRPVRSRAAGRRAHRAHHRRRRARAGASRWRASRASPPAACSMRRPTRSPRSTARRRWRCWSAWRRLARAKDPRVVQVMAGLAAEYDVVLVARADGTRAADVRPLVRVSVTVIAEQNGRREVGSGGGGGRFGLGYFQDELLASYVDQAVNAALTNLEARPAPAGEMSVVLGPGWPGVLLHEAVGHGLEGDFNRKGSSAPSPGASASAWPPRA